MVKGSRKRIITLVQFACLVILFMFNSACGIQKAQKTFLSNNALKGAHVGIAIYNDTKQQWINQYQSDFYFTPASNTKILACYLGMKYLGDSIPGFQLFENADSIFLKPLGDPTFLHPDFPVQPIAQLIQQTNKQVVFTLPDQHDRFEPYGKGWSWDDFADDYQPERNRFNIYGNVITVFKSSNKSFIRPSYFTKNQLFVDSPVNWTRKKLSNNFYTTNQRSAIGIQQIPFITDTNYQLVKALIEDSLHPLKPIYIQRGWGSKLPITIKTIPTDSLLKIMMHRSDNFYADQILLMSSEQLMHTMNDAAIIQFVLQNDLNGLPQKMQWVDGSGLSRFNLSTPENFIAVLHKMKNDFSLERLQHIFEQGGTGTLKGYYKNAPGVVFAKTGTLTNQVALSGFITTNKGTQMTFSILIANHINPSSADVRKAIEQYLTTLMRKY